MSPPQTPDFVPPNRSELFHESRYHALLGGYESFVLPKTRLASRFLIRKQVANTVGNYGMLDPAGELIYVGLSRQLRRRLTTYFSASTGSRKERRIGRHAHTILWQPAAHPLIAALRERELIQMYRPHWNVQGQPTGIEWGYIIEENSIAARFSLVREIPRIHSGSWGPVPYTKFVKADVEELNLHFQLRDCPGTTPFHFPGVSCGTSAAGFTPCLRADLQTCLAPCIGSSSRKKYRAGVEGARSFLNGGAQACLQQLTALMQKASTTKHFERAGQLRDRIVSLNRLQQFVERFHAWSRQTNFVYPIESALDQKTWWLFCLRGVVIKALPRPLTSQEKQVAGEVLQQMQRTLDGNAVQRNTTTPLDFATARLLRRWFRLFPLEVSQQISLAAAEKLMKVRNRRTSSKSLRN